MLTNALVFPEASSIPPPPALLKACRSANFSVQVAQVPQLEGFGQQLPEGARVLILPAFIEDCEGIKFAQLARVQDPNHEILLYSDELPGAPYLAKALQEGVGEVLSLLGCETTLLCQLRRAQKTAERKWAEQAEAQHAKLEIEKLKAEAVRLVQARDKQSERWQSLCGAALRLATGELNLTELSPLLHVVTKSKEQSERACTIAESIGFRTARWETGAEALKVLSELAPDLILCDGELTDMGATDFARQARIALGRSPVSIIAWSSSGASGENRLLGAAGGIDDLIVKGPEPHAQIAAALLIGLNQSCPPATEA